MKQPVLEVSALQKNYGKKQVLKGVDIRLEKGDFCGLIGPNGAGKTTLLRILTGLASPVGGTVRLFGQDGVTPAALRRMGCMVERPRVHPGMSARENLAMQQTLLGIPEDKTGAMLELVGLEQTGNQRVNRFSQGMKQRLGVGLALMGSPDFLCLDEPTNALDPQGIQEIRNLLLKLNREQGVTVLMSSHMLSEVEKVATSYAFLRDGVVTAFTAEDIRQKSRLFVRVVTGNPQAAAVVLDRFVAPGGYEVMPDSSFRLYDSLEEIAAINAAMVEDGIPVHELSRHNRTLEDIFMEQLEGGEGHA